MYAVAVPVCKLSGNRSQGVSSEKKKEKKRKKEKKKKEKALMRHVWVGCNQITCAIQSHASAKRQGGPSLISAHPVPP